MNYNMADLDRFRPGRVYLEIMKRWNEEICAINKAVRGKSPFLKDIPPVQYVGRLQDARLVAFGICPGGDVDSPLETMHAAFFRQVTAGMNNEKEIKDFMKSYYELYLLEQSDFLKGFDSLIEKIHRDHGKVEGIDPFRLYFSLMGARIPKSSRFLQVLHKIYEGTPYVVMNLVPFHAVGSGFRICDIPPETRVSHNNRIREYLVQAPNLEILAFHSAEIVGLLEDESLKEKNEGFLKGIIRITSEPFTTIVTNKKSERVCITCEAVIEGRIDPVHILVTNHLADRGFSKAMIRECRDVVNRWMEN